MSKITIKRKSRQFVNGAIRLAEGGLAEFQQPLQSDNTSVDKKIQLSQKQITDPRAITPQTQTIQDNHQGAVSKAWNVVSHPMTAATNLIKTGRLPDNFDKGEANPFDYALDVINPAFYANAIGRTAKAIVTPQTYSDVPKAIASGAVNLAGEQATEEQNQALGRTAQKIMDAGITTGVGKVGLKAIKDKAQFFMQHSSLPSMDKETVKFGLRHPDKFAQEYFGQNGKITSHVEYGIGKRNLNANYIHGDATGFEPIEYHDNGLKQGTKTYVMNSTIKHQEPISYTTIANTIQNSSNNKLKMFYPNDFASNFDVFKETMEKHAKELGSNGIIPIEIDPGIHTKTKNLTAMYSPVRPIDNVGGHMLFYDTNTHTLTTRDKWAFSAAYDKKWLNHINSEEPILSQNNISAIQRKALGMVGKPYALVQHNPVVDLGSKVKVANSIDLRKVGTYSEGGSIKLKR